METKSRILYTPPEFKKRKIFFKKGLYLTVSVFLILLLILSSVYLLRLPEWQIKKIEISGLKSLAENELLERVRGKLAGNYFGLVPKSSTLILSGEIIEHELKNDFSRIAEVNVDKTLPDTLRIFVKEREFFGFLCNDLYFPDYLGTTTPDRQRNPETKCTYLDNFGFAYEDGPNSFGALILKISTDLEKIDIPSQVLDPNLLEEMIILKEHIADTIKTNVVGYEYLFRVPGEVRILTGDGFKIIFSREEDLKNSFRVLKTVLGEEIKNNRGKLEYIDLRFGNKVFYKFRE